MKFLNSTIAGMVLTLARYSCSLHENTSHERIAFPFDFRARILVEIGDSWMKIPNLVKYHPSKNVVGLQSDFSGIVLQENTDLVVAITGHLCDDDSIVIEKRVPFVIKP